MTTCYFQHNVSGKHYFKVTHCVIGGDKTGGRGGTGGLGVGALENRGWECYMRQDEKELELGGWEAGAIAGDCATMLNILQLKKS